MPLADFAERLLNFQKFSKRSAKSAGAKKQKSQLDASSWLLIFYGEVLSLFLFFFRT
jgi:hypothetical protein